MSVWLFQANKQEYDLVEKVPSLLGNRDWWSVNQYLDQMKRDDVVLFWQSGEDAGIYAIGKLTSESYGASAQAGDKHRVNVTYDKVLTIPILKIDLTIQAVLRELDILKRPWAANPFQVKDDEWSALKLLIYEKPVGIVSPRAATSQIAEPMFGDKLYQERARSALPLLVRQAEAGISIFYSDFAAELGMSNPRNLNYVLGSIGQSLERLSVEWGHPIPPIHCLVVNKTTGLPGEGIGWFLLKERDFKALSLRQRRKVVQAELQRIFTYDRWREVLDAFSLMAIESDYSEIIAATEESLRIGGESPQHKMLKSFVAHHPEILGLESGTAPGATEAPLPSGDYLDVSFIRRTSWNAAEVKSSISDDKDIVRGLFQCVKYLAVMEAKLIAETRPQNARVVLVLEGRLPNHLVALKNQLGVEVIEGIQPDGIGSDEGLDSPIA